MTITINRRPASSDATPCDTNILRRIIANARAR